MPLSRLRSARCATAHIFGLGGQCLRQVLSNERVVFLWFQLVRQYGTFLPKLIYSKEKQQIHMNSEEAQLQVPPKRNLQQQAANMRAAVRHLRHSSASKLNGAQGIKEHAHPHLFSRSLVGVPSRPQGPFSNLRKVLRESFIFASGSCLW